MKALAILLALAGPALADAPSIRAPDTLRLQNLDAHPDAALHEASADGEAAALDVALRALTGCPLPIEEVAPAGDGACRIIRLGGITPRVACGGFRGPIGQTGTRPWRVVKLTGNQRLAGALAVPEGLEVRSLPVDCVGAEPATDYAGLPLGDQTPVEPGRIHAQAGLLFEQMSDQRARLLLPAEVLQSRIDILYATR